MTIIPRALVVSALLLAACEADRADRGSVNDGLDRRASPLTATGADRYQRVGIRQLAVHGGRVDWSPDGQRIVYDSKSAGFWRLRTMKPDGTDDQGLACSNVSFPTRRHIGQPAYHPGGEWIVMQVEKSTHRGDNLLHSSPGAGFYHDLWVMRLATRECFQLTDVRDGLDPGDPDHNPGGSLHPVFSRAGDRLLWTDLEDGIGFETGAVGDWRIAIAPVTLGSAPALGPTDYFEPGSSGLWYETHGWGPDDATVYFSGNTVGQVVTAADINTMPSTPVPPGTPPLFTRLTKTSGKKTADSPLVKEPKDYDEHAHFTRTDDAFLWMRDQAGREGRAESWMANLEGSGARQITHFNEDHPDAALVCHLHSNPSDAAWNPSPPAGREQLVLHMGVDWHLPNPTFEQVFLIEFSTDGSTDFDPGPTPPCPPPP